MEGPNQSWMLDAISLRALTDREILVLLVNEVSHLKVAFDSSIKTTATFCNRYANETAQCPLHPQPGNPQGLNVVNRLGVVEKEMLEAKGILRGILIIATPASLWAIYQLGSKLVEGITRST